MTKRSKISPAKSYWTSGISCSIFEREYTSKKGKPFKGYSVSVTKSFTGEDGKTDYTNSLSENDLLIASSMLERAYWWIKDQRNDSEESE